ncbi:MAG TPA: cyclase family protein, partial [Deinococcales bacterium]|nr:cyclase family protein [Deinococcales bacterium]
MNGILDVSRGLHNGHPTWPGDTPIEYRLNGRIRDGAAVNVGEIRMTLHAGTHVDAPWHYIDDGEKTDQIPLSTYVGPALVVDATGAGT